MATGQITDTRPLIIGAFFDAINVLFDANKIADKTNGSVCPDGSKGTMRVFVNDVLNENPRAYVWKNHDIIRIFFDSRTIEEVRREVIDNPITFPKLGRG